MLFHRANLQPVDVKTLSAKHPLCNVELFKRYEALYSGGHVFREVLCDFLPKQPQDTQEIYNLRLKEASYRPYVGQIVRAYAGALFSAPYVLRTKKDDKTVDLDAAYTAIKEDCDGQGSDLTSFFKDRFRKALVTCASYWLVQAPVVDSELSEKEIKARGLDRAHIVPLETSNVLDWEVADDGAYAWVKVFNRTVRRPDPGKAPIVVDTWTVYFPEQVEVYQINYDPKKPPKGATTVPMIDAYEHGFTRVPILCLRLPDGLWLLDAAADAQIEHFRLSCALGWSLRRSAYPLGIFNLQSGSEPPKTGPGLGVLLSIGEKFGWVEPSGSSLTVLRDEIKAQKDEIYRVSQQMAMSADNSSASIGRSGLSKLADADAADACLRDYAYFVREAIEATFELISNARGDYDLVFSVEGLNSFNSQDVETIVDVAKAAREFGIETESDTFRIESHCRIADLVLPADVQQDVKNKIREEISKAPKPIENNNGENRTATGEPTPAPSLEK